MGKEPSGQGQPATSGSVGREPRRRCGRRTRMRRLFVISAALAATITTAAAQHGPAYPEAGSDRGPNFPSSVSPNQQNPANWIGSPAPEEDQPYYAVTPREERWLGRWRRWR